MFVVLIAVSVAFVAVLAAVLAAAERQYDRPGSRSAQPTPSSEPPVGAERSVARLAPIIATCISDANRFLPRNSSEGRAVAQLRVALRLATDGDFQAEVRAVLDSIPDVVALHDVWRKAIGGPPADHLVVAPSGVTVVRSVVRTAKLRIQDDGISLDRDGQWRRDPTVDDVVRQVGAVVALLDNVLVQGVVLFQDVLTLPDEIREGTASVHGVRLLTLDGLETCVLGPDRAGPAPPGSGTEMTASEPVDVSQVVERLRSGFESAQPPAWRGLQLGGD